jgi:branched-chain amino acid transport system substrate-binding protein
LIHPARNVFRFTLDAAQSNAGLGAYAYRQLGWRTAAVVADDVPYAWEQAAGFTAEFCALGGRIVKRVWVPFGMDPADAAAMVPGAADGVYLGQAIIPMSAFLTRYAAQGHELARQLVASAEIVAGARALPRAAGVVVGGGAAAPPSAARRAYARAFARAFPSLPATEALSGTPPAFETGVDAVLAALTQAQGKSGPPLLAALASLRFDSPLGHVRLDRHRQAVGPNWLGRVTRQGIAPLHEVPGVEQTFGGYLTPATPPPSETSPTCRVRTPPAWAR